MRTKFIYLTTLVIFTLVSFRNADSQTVSENEAYVIASKWINIIKDKYGGWGVHKNAQPQTIIKIERDGKFLGYFCTILPEGFIIIYPRKDLLPIKAYNEFGAMDINSEEGLADLIKDRMEKVIDYYKDNNSGKVSDTWQFVYSYIPGTIGTSDDYQEGEFLLSSSWDQHAPYNNYCPDSSCATTTNGRCLVGCVATAGSQLMRYWQWPPYTNWINNLFYFFNWGRMKDVVTTSDPIEEQDAVAEICSVVGITVDMDYGCNGSSSTTSLMKDAYIDYFYYSSDCNIKYRIMYSDFAWTNMMIEEFTHNRPIHYRVDNHSIVADGWREVSNDFEFHMNYGWGGSQNAWFILDSIPLSIPNEEYMIIKILPENSLGQSLSGTYMATLTYQRYFDQDATGQYAVFLPHQSIQFLKGIKVQSTGTISFEGGDYPVVLYANEVMSNLNQVLGIEVNNNGKVILHNGGAIKFPK